MGNKPRYEIMSGRDSKDDRYLYVVDANGSPVQDDDGNVERFYDLDDAEEYETCYANYEVKYKVYQGLLKEYRDLYKEIGGK